MTTYLPLGHGLAADKLADQAHRFIQAELANGERIPSSRDNLMLGRCASQLMAVCECSRATAEAHAAMAIAEVASGRAMCSFDIDRSTSFALFVNDHRTGTTRCISAAELMSLLAQQEAAAFRAIAA